jgi:hypothetical protein
MNSNLTITIKDNIHSVIFCKKEIKIINSDVDQTAIDFFKNYCSTNSLIESHFNYTFSVK